MLIFYTMKAYQYYFTFRIESFQLIHYYLFGQFASLSLAKGLHSSLTKIHSAKSLPPVGVEHGTWNLAVLVRRRLLTSLSSHALQILVRFLKSSKSKNQQLTNKRQVKYPSTKTCQVSSDRRASDWNGGGPHFCLHSCPEICYDNSN